MTAGHFVSALAEIEMPDVFNPYSDQCEEHDRLDAPERRRANLEMFLSAAVSRKVDTIWIARDLGYRGGRRTGVPLTDEVHLDAMSRLFGGLSISRATVGPVVAERTAAVIWRVIEELNCPLFLWNVFPFHPHEAGDPMSNRCHTRSERDMCRPILTALFEMLRPRRIIAIGRDAQMALTDLGIEVNPVRHPSYGGQNEFIGGVFNLYGIDGAQREKNGSLFSNATGNR
jgi:uracil-DNA glycosylase